MTRRRLLMGTTAAARRHRADPHVVRAAAPHCSALVPQSSVPQLGSTGVAGTLGHGTKIRYISFPDVHNLYSSLPEPKLLDHGTKIRYISVPEVPTRYRTKKYLLGTKFCVADRIKLWRIDIRYLAPTLPWARSLVHVFLVIVVLLPCLLVVVVNILVHSMMEICSLISPLVLG